jgi:Predicted membrane protein (DUF2142)
VPSISLRTIWLLAAAAFFLLGAAWAVALPTNGTYDESQHIVRAYAVAHGDLFPSARAVRERDGYAFAAPASLLPADPDCTWRPSRQPASCQRPVADRSVVFLPSYSARYSPVYFLPVGLPMLVSPDHTGIVLGRLVSALLSALLLASAVVTAVRLGNRLLVAGVALVSTPMAMNLNGSINPNGLEISAGVLLFVALLALLRGGLDDPAVVRRLLALAAVATFLLLTVRLLGPLLFALVVAACLALARRERLRALLARPDARWLVGGAAVLGVAFTVYWTLAARLIHVVPLPDHALHLGTGALLRRIATVRGPFYLHQVVGQFSYGETTISTLAVYGWYALAAALVLPALVLGGWRLRLVVTGLVVACGLLLVTLEARYAPVVGWSQHGRYAMPALVGAVLVAAAYADRFADRLADRGWLGRFVLGTVAATAPLHLYALARVMTRFQIGIDARLDPLGGSWHPPVGSVTPLLTELTGLVLLVGIAAITARATVRPRTRQGVRRTTTVGRSSPLDR